MRIAVDARETTGPNFGGLSGYTVHLTRALAHAGHDVTALLPTCRARESALQTDEPNLRFRLIDTGTWTPSVPRFREWWEQELLPGSLAGHGYDVFLSPAFTKPLRWNGPSVVVVHDLAFEYGSRFNSPSSVEFYRRWAARCAQEADCVIAVSDFTREEINQRWGLGDKTVVAYPAPCLNGSAGNNKESEDRAAAAIGVETNYALYVGGRFPRKNMRRLLEGVARVAELVADFTLVLAVKSNGELDLLVDELGIGPNIKFAGFVPAEDLPHVYATADFLVYPSLYEGFGLPPLEAACCGTPSAVSDIEPLREVMGEAAVFFDPNDVAAIAQAIYSLAKDVMLRNEIAKSCMERSKHFDWSASAQVVGRALEQAVAIHQRNTS